MMTSKNIKPLISKLKKQFSNQPLLQSFSEIICNQMSQRTLAILNYTELCEFILILYDFSIVKYHSKSNIFLGKPKLKSKALTNEYILKMSQPDASHLFFTLEEIFRKYNLRTSRRLHPIFDIVRNSFGKITSIAPASNQSERRSLVFTAFNLTDDSVADDLLKDIKFHMKAVQLAENDQSSIRSKLTQVHYQLNQSTSEHKEEWMCLIDWLSNQNFSFFWIPS